jgi:hypothetical protein
MSKPIRDLECVVPASARDARGQRMIIPQSTPPEVLTEALDGEWDAVLAPKAEPSGSRALMAAKSASRAAVAARTRKLSAKSGESVQLTALPPAQRR